MRVIYFSLAKPYLTVNYERDTKKREREREETSCSVEGPNLVKTISAVERDTPEGFHKRTAIHKECSVLSLYSGALWFYSV